MDKTDNELIAEFMGTTRRNMHTQINGRRYNILTRNLPHSLKYHTSIEWLYPVIQKIAGHMLTTKFKGTRGLNKALSMWRPIANRLENAMDVKLLHESVVEWIKWYNSNKKA